MPGMNTNDYNCKFVILFEDQLAPSRNASLEFLPNVVPFTDGQTIFLASFLAAELPSGLISKKIGADRWIPFLIVSWSIVAGSQAFLSNRAGFFAIKALLGLLMGGFIPDIVLWLTYFYTSKELPTRLSFFVSFFLVLRLVPRMFSDDSDTALPSGQHS